MNWLLIIVILFLIFHIFWGHRKGFVKVVYSMIQWIVILALVIALTPAVARVLREQTQLYQKIEQKVVQQMDKKLEADVGLKTGNISDAADSGNKELDKLSLKLPESVAKFVPSLGALVDDQLEESGVYQMVASEIATLALNGIAGIIVLLGSLLGTTLIIHLLGVFDYVPGIRQLNRGLGAIAGFVKGMVIVWGLMAILAVEVTTEPGQFLVASVYDSFILRWIYENNLILTIVTYFF